MSALREIAMHRDAVERVDYIACAFDRKGVSSNAIGRALIAAAVCRRAERADLSLAEVNASQCCAA